MKLKFSKKGSENRTEMKENVVQTGSKWSQNGVGGGPDGGLEPEVRKRGPRISPQRVKQEPLGGPGTHFDDMLVSYGELNGRSIVPK